MAGAYGTLGYLAGWTLGEMILGCLGVPLAQPAWAADPKPPAILAKAGQSNGDGSLGGLLPTTPMVLRSAAELEAHRKSHPNSSSVSLESVLGVKEIDWSRQMVVAVRQALPSSRAGLPPVEFTGTRLEGGTLVVDWALVGQPAWCSTKGVGVALVERFDGPVRFQGPAKDGPVQASFPNPLARGLDDLKRPRSRELDCCKPVQTEDREPLTRWEIYYKNCKDPKK